MAWRLFQWGSRGLYYDAGEGVYVAHRLINQAVQVNVQGTYFDGRELLNVFHVRTANVVPTLGDCQAIAVAVHAWFTLRYKPLCNLFVACHQIVATSIAEVNGAQYTEPVNEPGTRAGDKTPGNTTLCLKKAGTSRGRRRRGRIYLWPATGEDITQPDTFKDEYVVDAELAFNGLISDLNDAGYDLAIASFVDEALYNVSAFVAVDNLVDDQRRRLANRGA